MNIELVRGKNCRVQTFGPDLDAGKLKRFYASYRRSGDRAYSRDIFETGVRAGDILNAEVIAWEGHVMGRFGVEFECDYGGPYVQLLYLEGRLLERWADQMIRTVYDAAQFAAVKFAEPRCRVVGRLGWRRWLRKHGIRIDDDGFIGGWQEVFCDG